MSEIEEVQEQMKVDMEAMKEQMTTMMEAMMSIRKMMVVNTAIEVDPTHPSGLNQVNCPALDMVGQRGEALGSAGDPYFVQVQSKHSFPPYGLPPNYTPPNVAHAPDENVDNSALILIESQQPQSEYAQRWRDLAAQVAPPMMEREMITMIVDTLPVFYYEKMVGYMPSCFVDLVFTGERIEVSLRRGKFDYPALMNMKLGANGENKKEGGTHVVTVVPTWPNFPPAQQYQYSTNISPSHYPPPYQPRTPNHPQRPPLNQP
ncbi:hypothetical protein GmHk_01G000549 [Glycine max]|nr:hypothetical protein GmHk_01G000549 [Glycine max]